MLCCFYNCWFCNKGLDLVRRHLCGQFITTTILTSISSNFIHVLWCFICYLYGYVYSMLSMCLFHTTKFHACQFFAHDPISSLWEGLTTLLNFTQVVYFLPLWSISFASLSSSTWSYFIPIVTTHHPCTSNFIQMVEFNL